MKIPHITILKKYIGKSYIRNPESPIMNNEVHVLKVDKHMTQFKTKFGHKEAMTTPYFLKRLENGELIALEKKKVKTKTKPKRSHGKK
jgi:hypothetical protein